MHETMVLMGYTIGWERYCVDCKELVILLWPSQKNAFKPFYCYVEHQMQYTCDSCGAIVRHIPMPKELQ